MTTIKIAQDLASRGLLHQASDDQLDRKLSELAAKTPGTIAAYAGFDPTADSLHVGHYIGIRALMFAQKHGIRPIAIVGGATGLIGDPSGRSSERSLISKEQVERNVQGLKEALSKFLDFNHPTAPAIIVNNVDWFGAMSAIDFLRDVGKHFKINLMLSKDSVKKRMEQDDEGMSYTEFSYQLLQGYDFYKLFKDHGCVLQMGGSDQWGNIIAGIDLIRKLTHPLAELRESKGYSQAEVAHFMGVSQPTISNWELGKTNPDGDQLRQLSFFYNESVFSLQPRESFGITLPLITDSQGNKFGKSAGNAVWLSAEKTKPYIFAQFWLRTEDADVERFLKFFTDIPLLEISELMVNHSRSPHLRLAQQTLAQTMTSRVHGKDAWASVLAVSEILFGGEIRPGMDPQELAGVISEVPCVQIARSELNAGLPVIPLLVRVGFARSNSESRKLIAGGGFYVNNRPWTDLAKPITKEDLTISDAILLRCGKKNYKALRIHEHVAVDSIILNQ